MEQPSAELDALLDAEVRHSRRVLDALPDRAALLARVRELSNAGVEVTDLALWKGTYVYLESEPGRDGRSLYARTGLVGVERRLIDAEFLGHAGARPAVDFFAPSIDGRFIAYGFSTGGASDGVLRMLQASNGAALPDTLDRLASPDVAWQTDGRSFYVLRHPPPGAAPPGPRVHLHDLGQDPATDPAVFGPGVVPGISIGPADLCEVSAPPGNRSAFVAVRRGGRREIDLYAAPVADLPEHPESFRKIADADAQAAVAFDVHGDDLYLLSHEGAPRFKVIRTSIAHPFALRPSVMVAESEAVITGLGVARDALYLRMLDHGAGKLRRISFKGGRGEPVPLPFDGQIPRWFVQPFAPGVIVELGSPTAPARFFAFDPKTKEVTDLRLAPPLPLDLSSLGATAFEARSADGTAVPLTLVHRKDLAQDGAHPALLRALGAFGALADTTFHPADLAFLERGGVIATCAVRGGGERGEAWHRAAMGEHKVRSVDDYLACAEALAQAGWSKPGRIAAQGEGASVLVAASAIARKPSLFGAALLRGGLPDPLRLDLTRAGPAWAAEIGRPDSDAGWAALLAVDATLQAADSTRYPPLLATTRRDDPASPPWQAEKLVARLRAAGGEHAEALLRIAEGTGKARDDEALADDLAFLFEHLR